MGDPEAPRLGTRGRLLWEAYSGLVDGAKGLVLLAEAARIADRLDKLDALLQGDADVWCRLVHGLRSEDYELKIDSALIEARQQANTLRQILDSLPVKEGPRDPDPADGWLDGVSP
jgi:hypothetical protein